jgi:serine/threonine protein kinase
MGNSSSSAAISNSDLSSDMLLHTKFFFEEEMRGCRYIKTIRCLQNEAKHIVKSVVKASAPAEVIDRFKAEVERLHRLIQEQSVCRVLALRLVGESARCVYACRPYVYTDLRRRSTSRPFLVQQERLLIVYGMLLAVEQLHHAGIVHGDIKSSNLLLTSTNLVFLADVTPWKPVLLPADNTAQLSNFFETDIDVRCSVAPERFYEAGAAAEVGKRSSAATLEPSMDIFSVGCLIFELLTDKPLFGLPELRQHSQGKFNLDAALMRPSLQPLTNIVRKCVDLNPAARLNIWEILDLFRTLVPQTAAFESFVEPSLRTSATMIARDRLQKIMIDSSVWLLPESKDITVHAVNIVVSSSGSADPDARALVADCLARLAPYCDNDILLQRIIPCCVQLMSDAAGRTQVKLIDALLLACKCVTAVPPADSEIMPLYILPSFSKAASVQDAFDSSSTLDAVSASERDTALPQMQVAMRIYEIASESLRFVELSARSLANAWVAPVEAERLGSEVSVAPSLLAAAAVAAVKNEVETHEMRVSRVREDIVTILKGLLKSAFVGTQVALLNNVVSLGSILGRKLFKEVLLPYLVSMLNFSPSYLVRVAFFSALSNMALVVGGRTVKQIYLPLYERQLSTAHNEVELEVTLKGLFLQADAGLAIPEVLLPLVKSVAPFMLHYSSSVRVLAVSFISAVAEKLGEVETRISLLPSIRRYFTKDPILVSFASCTSSRGCLKPPISQHAFHFAATHFNDFLSYCKGRQPDYCRNEQPLQSDDSGAPSPAHGVGSKLPPRPPIHWHEVIKDDTMLFGCAQLASNIKSLAVSNMRRHEVKKVLDDIVGDEWLQEEWNASFWNTTDEQFLPDSPSLTPMSSPASAGQNPFLVRAPVSRVPLPLKPSPLIDGVVVGALSTMNARVVALLPSPDCSWLVATSGCGDILAYDCVGLLDEAFVAPFVLHLQCEVHAASAVPLSNSYPCVGFVVVGGDKGFVHIVSIEAIRPDSASRSRSIFSGSSNSSRRTEIVSYKLNHICTLSMECDSGRVMSVCAFAPAQNSVFEHVAPPLAPSDQTPSTWHLLSYCTGKPYIAHWIMHTHIASQSVSAPKLPRRIEIERALGGVQSMAVAPCGLWMAAGTSRGFICICDLRFSVLVKKIYSGSDTILSTIVICSAPPVTVDPSDNSSSLMGVKKNWFGSRAASKFAPLSPPGIPMGSAAGGASAGDACARVWVIAPSGGAGGDSVCAHNVSTACCDAKFEITRGHTGGGDPRLDSLTGMSSSVSAKDASRDEIARDRYATQSLLSQSVFPTVRAISVASSLGGGGAGGMFTTGSDRHLRYWSFAHPEHCSCVLLPPLGSPVHSEIFAHRCENGCALFSAQAQEDSEKGEAATSQQRYRKGLDALAQSSVGDLVGVTAMCMIGR